MDVTKTKRMKSIEEKAKAYDEAIKRGLDYIRQTPATEMVTRQSILEHIFPELKESEDEKMIQYFKDLAPFDKADELYEKYGFSHKDAIAWLEKQTEHANFRNKIQIGDKVTRNEDGVLVNLSQLNRVAKKDEKQGKQKPADKVEPKFHVGDKVKKGYLTYTVEDIDEDSYKLQAYSKDGNKGCTVFLTIGYEKDYELVEQKPSWGEEDEENRKNILYILNQLKGTAIYKEDKTAENCIDWLKSLKGRVGCETNCTTTKEWSEEDEQMFEHIIEKATLKFSEWNCLKNDEINFLKSLHPQNKQEWTQDDIDMIDWLIRCCEKEYEGLCNDRYGHQDIVSDLKRDCRKKWDWLESLKEKVAPQKLSNVERNGKNWKPSDEQMATLEYYMHALIATKHKEILFGLYNDLKQL